MTTMDKGAGGRARRRGRAQLKGVAQLPAPCRRARTSRFEFGPDDHRVFCYGLMDYPENLNPECLTCGAFVDNARPLEGATP